MTQDPHPPLGKPNQGRLWPLLTVALLVTSVGLGLAYQFKPTKAAEYTDAQLDRVREAYVFEHYFCQDQDLKGILSHSDAVTSQSGLNLTSTITCYLQDGGARQYEVKFNQEAGTMEICDDYCIRERQEPEGPPSPA